MRHDRAIFVPTHGVPEAIHAVRFGPKPAPSAGTGTGTGTETGLEGAPATSLSTPIEPPVVEISYGDYYGDRQGPILCSFSTANRSETAFPDRDAPVIPPERSLVVVIGDPPSAWEVEFETTSIDAQRSAARRIVAIDSFGTRTERDVTANESVAATVPP